MRRLASGLPDMASRVELPAGDAIFLDHLAHWVPDIHAAATLLGRLGFVVTPYAEHVHATKEGTPTPAGSANHCVMLARGYLEVLTPIGETPIAREVRAALARYTGLHLAAFCVEDAERHHARLVAEGFPQRACVTLSRETSSADGQSTTLRFTVARPEVDCLPEGRVQFLTHHTPEALWQPRWLAHPNTARALTDMLFCVRDPREAGARYERYLGRRAEPIDGGRVLQLDRGRLALLDAERVSTTLPAMDIPRVPFMAAYALECASLARATASLQAGAIEFIEERDRRVVVPPLPALGGTIVFTAPGALPPWL